MTFPRFVLFTFVVLLFYPSMAQANRVELEVDADDIATTLSKNIQFRSMVDCAYCPTEIVSMDLVIDDISFPNTSSTRSVFQEAGSSYSSVSIPEVLVVDDDPLLFLLRVRIGVKTIDDFEDPTTNINDFTYVIPITVVYSVTMDGDEIVFEYEDIVSTSVYWTPAFQTYADAYIDSSLRLPLETDGITQNPLLDGMVLAYSGISISPTGDRLVIRMEFSDDGSVSFSPFNIMSWDQFYNSWSSSIPGADEWSVLLHENLLGDSIQRRVEEAIAARSFLTLDSISSSWVPAGLNGGTLETDMDITANPDEVPGICKPIDVDASLDIDIYGDGDELVVEGDVDINYSLPWACNLVGGIIFGPTFGLLKDIFTDVITIDFSLNGNCTTWNDGMNFECREPIPSIPRLDIHYGYSSPTGDFQFDRIRGVSNGLVIEGDYFLWNDIPPERLSGSGYLYYGLSGNCYTMSCGYHGGLSLDGRGKLCHDSGNEDIYVQDDPYDVYDLFASGHVGHRLDEGHIEIRFDSNNNDFWTDPYPLLAHVNSTVGGKTFEIDYPEQATFQDRMNCMFAYIYAQGVHCHQLESRIPGFFWPWWLIFPPYEIFNGFEIVLDMFATVEFVPEQENWQMMVNIEPVALLSGEQIDTEFGSCHGAIHNRDGVLFNIEFGRSGSPSLTMPASLFREFEAGTYLAEVTCSAIDRETGEFGEYSTTSTFYVDYSSMPACTSTDCDLDGIHNLEEIGDANLNGMPDAYEAPR